MQYCCMRAPLAPSITQTFRYERQGTVYSVYHSSMG
jgi:hypothetical protein